MARDNRTGVTNEEFQVAIYALCAEQDACDHGLGCRCTDAQIAAGDVAWTVLNAIHEHRKNS